MKTEPELDRNALGQLVKMEYGIELTKLTFIPTDELIISFTAISRDKTYSLKIYPPARLAKDLNENLDLSLSVCSEIYFKLNIRNITFPLPSMTSGSKALFDESPVVISEIPDGKIQDNVKLNKDELENLAKLLASIHKNSDQLDTKKVPNENFSTYYKDQLIQGLEVLEQGKELNTKHKIKLAELLVSRKTQILTLLKQTEDLINSDKFKEADLVLCHTEPRNMNLIVTKSRDVFILNWDNVKMAPKEKDIWYYLLDNPTQFLDSYKSVFDNCKLNGYSVLYFIYNGILEELTHSLLRILYEKLGEEENKNILKQLQTNTIKNLDSIGKTVKNLDKIIKKY